jgi:hypothetical protein
MQRRVIFYNGFILSYVAIEAARSFPMYHLIHQATFYIHILVGSASLIIFWLPLFATKGSQRHRQLGHVFTNCMYVVTVTGIVMSSLVLLDPIAVRLPDGSLTGAALEKMQYRNRIFAMFLMMLSVLVLANVRQAVLVLQAKADRDLLRTRSHLSLVVLLGVFGVLVAIYGVNENILLFQIFAAVSIFNSVGMLHYIFKSTLKNREWLIAHLGNIIGAGIGSYTAFFAFGGRKIFAELLTGNWQVVPWILPAIIGVSATIYLDRKYRRQYRVA